MPFQINQAEEFAKYGAPDRTSRDCDFIEQMLKSIEDVNPKIVDLGCGTGRHTIELAKRGFDVLGIDVSESIIRYAVDHTPVNTKGSCRFEVHDFKSMSFENEFDCAIMMYHTLSMLVTNDDLLALLRGVRRLLTDEGMFLVQLYSEWKFISEGTFRNENDTSTTHEPDGLTRILERKVIISNINNVRDHFARSRYIMDGIETPGNSESFKMRVFSLNEIDLACRLSGLQLKAVYSGENLDLKVVNYNDHSDDLTGFETMYIIVPN